MLLLIRCTGVKLPKRKNKEGFVAWTEDGIQRYHAKWPLGTKERVWLNVLLCTGLQRGDTVRIGRQHVRDSVAYLKTEKGGYRADNCLANLVCPSKNTIKIKSYKDKNQPWCIEKT